MRKLASEQGKGLETGAAIWVAVQFDEEAALHRHLVRRLTDQLAATTSNSTTVETWLDASKTQKDTKIEGTNSLKSFRINKSDKKRTQNELVLERKNAQTKRKMGPKCWKMEIRKSKIGELLRSFVVREGLLGDVGLSDPSSPRNRPLTRPAPAGKSAGGGPPSPLGRGQDPIALQSVSDSMDNGLRLCTLRMTMERSCHFRISSFDFPVSSF
jgi:hypothetical protein